MVLRCVSLLAMPPPPTELAAALISQLVPPRTAVQWTYQLELVAPWLAATSVLPPAAVLESTRRDLCLCPLGNLAGLARQEL
jgi:hypothetical protein